MKRANQLQPLSRQHHLGLNLSRHAKNCANEPHKINEHWHKLTAYIDQMRTHFDIEDDIIATALAPYRDSAPEVATALDTLNEQHVQLHKLISNAPNAHTFQTPQSSEITATQVQTLGRLLYDHIRFEERELFPLAERYLTEEQLDAVYAASSDSIKRIDENR